MSENQAEKAKRKNYEDLKRAGESRKKDQRSAPGSRTQNSPAATKRARKDANAAQRTNRSWIAREHALKSGSPMLLELIIAAAQGISRRLATHT